MSPTVHCSAGIWRPGGASQRSMAIHVIIITVSAARRRWRQRDAARGRIPTPLAAEVAEGLRCLFRPLDGSTDWPDEPPPSNSWQARVGSFAGLVTVADWLGSAERFFSAAVSFHQANGARRQRARSPQSVLVAPRPASRRTSLGCFHKSPSPIRQDLLVNSATLRLAHGVSWLRQDDVVQVRPTRTPAQGEAKDEVLPTRVGMVLLSIGIGALMLGSPRPGRPHRERGVFEEPSSVHGLGRG